MVQPTFFPTEAEFRRWLEANHTTAPELLVGFWKKASLDRLLGQRASRCSAARKSEVFSVVFQSVCVLFVALKIHQLTLYRFGEVDVVLEGIQSAGDIPSDFRS